MTRRIVPLAAAALFLAASASAEGGRDSDRFKLWSECQPMRLAVEGLQQTAADIGLTRDAIETAVRSRLRGARLYDDEGLEYLYVNVNVTRHAFSMLIEYHKPVMDLASGQVYPAGTWNTGAVGTHGRDAGYVLSWVSQYADKFIDEYLRVNAESCGR